MKTLCTDDAEAAAAAASDHIRAAINRALDARKVAHVALAGGATPRRAYELLAGGEIDWADVVLWLGDERMLPVGHPERNATMVQEALLFRLDGPQPGLREVAGTGRAEIAAQAYERQLLFEVAPNTDGIPELDLAVLGLGEDGHTASLFPGSAALAEDDRLVMGVNGAPKPPPNRVTMTLPLLSAAREILLLATGRTKIAPVATILGADSASIPAGRLAQDHMTLIADRLAMSGVGPPV